MDIQTYGLMEPKRISGAKRQRCNETDTRRRGDKEKLRGVEMKAERGVDKEKERQGEIDTRRNRPGERYGNVKQRVRHKYE